MKLSKEMLNSKMPSCRCLAGKVVVGADRRIAASHADGMGQFCIAAPKGVDYVPQAEDDAVLLQGEKEKICIGVRRVDNPYAIEPGELALYSQGGASIILKNDGTVLINGQPYTGGNNE